LSLETRRRVEQLLEKLSGLSPQRVQAIRGLKVLERLDTAESRRLVAQLAAGQPGAWLTREAQAIRRRLASKREQPEAPAEKSR
jgi:hypothetical protein